jgi:hypothetical protein
MNCCGCGKTLAFDLRLNDKGEAEWYGKYKGWVCIKAICNKCIKDPEKKEKYRND